MSDLTAAQLIAAVDLFLGDYSQDSKYADAVRHLQSAQKTLRETLPAAQDSPGRREVTAVAGEQPATAPAKQEPEAEPQGPKDFKDASAQARERIVAGRA